MNFDYSQIVFTTKYVIQKESEIVFVAHDKEGEWQFFGRENDVHENDARIVSLKEIIDLDPTLNDILWIPEGTEARRARVGSEWTTGVSAE